MKTLVVYYSRTGNSRKIASELAEALDAEVEELRERANRQGPKGYMLAGRDALRKRPAELLPLKHNPADYDLLVVGGPCWAFTMCTPTRTYVLQHKENFKKTAIFATAQDTGSARRAVDATVRAVEMAPVATMAITDSEIAGDHAQRIADFVAALNGAEPQALEEAAD